MSVFSVTTRASMGLVGCPVVTRGLSRSCWLTGTRAAKIKHSKTPGPAARTVMPLLAPIMIKTVMNPEKTMGPEQRYRIDWDAPAGSELAAA
ncbi:hypothetical protein [Nocardia sp. R6R-6]|uniref:hypothetical protein n=1 Tax=Nocardia sp. R6R-6 TaxID=3459303 RepID=UPI00403DB565